MIAVWQLNVEPEVKFGQIQLNPPPSSLDAGTHQLPAGGYTTFRTFHKFQVLKLTDHFDRLEETARLAGQPLKLNRPAIRGALRQALLACPFDEARVRLSIDFTLTPGVMYILVEALKVPGPEAYQEGVRVVTRELHRENPKAKLTNFIDTAAEIRKDLPAGINEALMVGADQRVLEGLSSNFFGILNGVVYTAEQGVLSGITRSQVIEYIQEEKIPLVLEGVPVAWLADLDEAFITSTSRAVLPVTEINGVKVGEGVPGPLTKKILSGYWAKIEAGLESLS